MMLDLKNINRWDLLDERGLIAIEEQKGQRSVNARELHRFLKIKHRFNDWINNRIQEYGFVDNEDFKVLLKKTSKPTGGIPQ